MKNNNRSTPSQRLLGKRLPKGSLNPDEYIKNIHNVIEKLNKKSYNTVETLKDLKVFLAPECRYYYSLCAMSRRKYLPVETATKLKNYLFKLRSLIEKVILSCLTYVKNQKKLNKAIYAKSYFGVSAKQGVSIRYPLYTCNPTKFCGCGCYAHDGRDRELHILFRAVLNFYAGLQYENGYSIERNSIIDSLSSALVYGVESSLNDKSKAFEKGFSRAPRIRFSHIGEMVVTPEFTNRLAWEIHRISPDIRCVLYTKHKHVNKLSPEHVIINFTIENDEDPRLHWAPKMARIVGSAWKGCLAQKAEINFLEHHVEKFSKSIGNGSICPVTLNHSEIKSCDEAKCDLCFRDLKLFV